MPHGQHIVHIGERQVDVLGSDVLGAIEKVVDDAQIRVFERRLELNESAIKIRSDDTLSKAHQVFKSKLKDLVSVPH